MNNIINRGFDCSIGYNLRLICLGVQNFVAKPFTCVNGWVSLPVKLLTKFIRTFAPKAALSSLVSPWKTSVTPTTNSPSSLDVVEN